MSKRGRLQNCLKTQRSNDFPPHLRHCAHLMAPERLSHEVRPSSSSCRWLTQPREAGGSPTALGFWW